MPSIKGWVGRVPAITPNGFGISEVAGGISERSGEIPKGNFAYSVLCEVASVSERRAEPELFPKPLCRKGASDPTDRREGGGASDFGITSAYI